ncbi:MAG: DUF116 domain-containing protein [Desulfovibrio sp.]|nr:DUF116 domain-containing protein [Desulfovibrio sp.]
MWPTKSPHSLPSAQYGGGRKRIFIGLMVASCVVVCLALFAFLVLPWLVPASVTTSWLPLLSLSCGLCGIVLLAWLCATLIFHIYTGRRLPGISWVRHVLLRLFLPFMESLGRLCGIGRTAVRRSFVKINNELVLADGIRVPASDLLLLLPHCVQNSRCRHRISPETDNCQRCGACQIGPLLDLRDRYGFRLALATGGTIARRIVVECRPACIIAVACERDLVSGIQDSYPLPVFGVLNERPHGPCRDTLVPLAAVEDALARFLLPKSQAGAACP